MGQAVVAGVESPAGGVESSPAPAGAMRPLRVRLLGPMTIQRDGVALVLPASRKLRALIAYLALAPQPSTRDRLCELLWDVPNDPRGELRWCLSKARALLDGPDRRRVATALDTVWLATGDGEVDVLEIGRALQRGIESLDVERLRALAALFVGDLLEGLEIDRSPHFSSWLVAQRRRLRGSHVAVLEHLVARLDPGADEALGALGTWLQRAPFDRRAHELLLRALAHRGQVREGEEHLATAVRAFEAEGLDPRWLREAWQAPRPRPAAPAVVIEVSPVAAEPPGPVAGPRRASIAVMPFFDRSAQAGLRGGLADGLAHDIITRLAKLRSLFVIAQGTVFALDQRRIGPEEAGRTLNVDYVVSGALRRQAGRLVVEVELAQTRTARIVWAESFDHRLDDALLALDEIGNRIVASAAGEIEAAERQRAILKAPSSLDAWEAHHRGLWHMYRFNRADNEQARHFFQMAVRLDPTYARAHAGLSFTHWQSAFQRWGEREHEIDRAFEAAGQSLLVDDRDPAAHWAMGRALWLRGRQAQSLAELQSAVDLSPNFALGHYALAFVHSQSGDAQAAIAAADHSRHLSPFDPLLFGMLAARAMALVRLGRFDEAAAWAVRAAARPNAHAHILAIAAECLALADRLDEARAFVATIHRTVPDYGIDDFLAAFCFPADDRPRFRQAAQRIGLG